MSKEVGKAHIDVDFDGNDLPRQARQHGGAAGAEAAKAYNKEFRKNLADFGKNLSQAMDDGGSVRDVTLRIRTLASEQDRAAAATRRHNTANQSLWKGLSANTRQWTLIIGAIAAGGESIAGLGSAAGAGLTVLGSLLSSVTIGVGSTIAVFKGLNGELSKLDPAVRPAAKSFQELGKSFGLIRKELQGRALKDAAGDFDSLRGTVEGLVPAFGDVGDSIGRMIRGFAEGLAPGTRNFENLSRLVKTSGPIFERVGAIVGTFAEGLLEAFASPDMNKSVNQLLDWLDELGTGFRDFTRSDELGVWLRRAENVFGSLGKLLDATGKMLNKLVDDKAIGRLTGFLDTLTAFMPDLGDLLSVLGELDVFGLLAEMLDNVGDALKPLVGPTEDLFAALNKIVGIALDQWGDDLAGVAKNLAPLTQSLADFLSDVKPEDIRKIATALGVLAGAALVLKGAQGLAGLGAAITTNLGVFGTAVPKGTWSGIGKNLGKGGAAAFLPALITGLLSGEGGAGMTIGTAALTGLSFGGVPGMVAGAFIGAIVSAFTDTGAWTNGADQIRTFVEDTLNNSLNGANWENGAEQIKVGISQWLADLGLNFQNGGAQIAAAWQGFWNGMPAAASNGWAQISAAFGNGWAQISASFINGGNQLGAMWSGMMSGLSAAGSNGWAQISGAFGNGWNQITGAFNNGANQIGGAWNGMWTGLQGAAQNGWNQIQGGVGGWWAGLQGAFNNGGNQISGTWTRFINGLPSAAQNGWNQITSSLAGFWGGLRGAFANGANQIGGVWSGMWSNIRGTASGAIGGIQGLVGGLINSIRSAISQVANLSGSAGRGLSGGGGGGGGGGGMASGGIVTFGARRLIGEDGPEAVVPLDRPLSEVDPAVRALSALAQGKGGRLGGTENNGKTVIVEEGAIQLVAPVRDPSIAATMVLDGIVEQIAGG